MRKLLALPMMLLSTACDKPAPVIATVDTLCTVTTRYHASDAQIAAFKAERGLWEPLVRWMASFNDVRDRQCLQGGKGQ